MDEMELFFDVSDEAGGERERELRREGVSGDVANELAHCPELNLATLLPELNFPESVSPEEE